ncbi:ice-binding family protein [Pseudonocardia xinjiangensis]|uniref:ice-binding family protein n=1 Tax=Pseudonocardia xinjiangensis TaxID=75289 RepID=UPI003D8FEF3F
MGTAAVMVLMVGVAGMSPASAQSAQAPVGLGTATSFAVLAGSTVTNTGPSVISGDVGVSPGSAIVGFPPGIVVNGVFHAADAVAAQAQDDLTTAYNDAAGRSPVTAVGPELGGLTLAPGVYGGGTLQITGTLTLDAQGDPNAVFIFQAASTLITASASDVSLINGADPCNVFWQVGSSATLGTGSDFVGTILALTSITAQTGADVEGRLLARNGAVTLDTNTITRPDCDVVPPTTTTTAPPTTSPTVTPPIPPVVIPPIVIPPIVIGPITIPGITIPGIGDDRPNFPNFPGFPGFPGDRDDRGDRGDRGDDRGRDEGQKDKDKDKYGDQNGHEKDSHKSYDNAESKDHDKDKDKKDSHESH